MEVATHLQPTRLLDTADPDRFETGRSDQLGDPFVSALDGRVEESRQLR